MVKKRNRDDFSAAIKDRLSKRSGHICSNPGCHVGTCGPGSRPNETVNIGEASHIFAAAPGGHRYDSKMTPEQRSSIENGIWLCRNCAKLVDSDELKYTAAVLRSWKQEHENSRERTMSRPRHTLTVGPGQASKTTPTSLLVEGQMEHCRELESFGKRLRDCFGLLLPLDAAALDVDDKALNLWRGDVYAITGTKGWNLGSYDARGDSLFTLFKQHLSSDECWAKLEDAETLFRQYQKICEMAYRGVRERINKKIRNLPDSFLEPMADSLFVDACYRAGGTAGIAFSYEPKRMDCHHRTRWYLQLGAWGVGDQETPQGLEILVDTHREMAVALPSTEEFGEVIRIGHAVRKAVAEFQRALSPDARLRKLVLFGHCELCC